MENDKDKHLLVVQKYSSGEIYREKYTRTLGYKYKARTQLYGYTHKRHLKEEVIYEHI